MIEALEILQWIIAGALALPLLVVSAEIMLGLPTLKSHESHGEVPSTCILIPAHDEQDIIAETLERLHRILPSNAFVLIVADNCTDKTAEIAREKGFQVIERSDTEQRGKGFALAYGRDWLSKAPPDCVIVFDADCATDMNSLASLARFSMTNMSVVQAGYTFAPEHSLAPNVQISNFALWVKNIIRQRGSSRLGGCAILTGTGMAFPWKIFANLPLATESIVEDLALTIDLALSRQAPVYLDQARVFSFAATEVATLAQRSRWEHGFLGTATKWGFSILRSGLAQMDRKLMLLGLHLLVPPLALLLMVALAGAIGLAAVAGLIGNWLPFLVVAALLSLALFSVGLSWCLGGHRWLESRALFRLPIYFAWKIPIYLRFALGRTVAWVRTERDIRR